MTKVEKEIMNTIKDNNLTVEEAKETLAEVSGYIDTLSKYITVDTLWEVLKEH